MPLGFDVIPSRRRTLVRPALLAMACSAAACRSHPEPAVTPTPEGPIAQAVPRGAANGPCGSRAAVAVTRTHAVRGLTHAPVPGALVVRVLAADSGGAAPTGPVRLVPTRAVPNGTARVVTLEDRGIARTGPMAVGRWVVEASGRGYETRRLTVAVRPGATDTVRFRLPRACVQQRTSR